MDNKKDKRDKVFLYLASLITVANYIILWFMQMEIFLYVSIGIAILGLLGTILKVSRSAYIKTIISLRFINIIGVLFVVNKAIKYILISGNVLNLLSEGPFKDLLSGLANLASIALIIVILLVLLIINSLVLISYNLVYLVKLHKEKDVSVGKSILSFFGYGIPLIGWIFVIMHYQKFETLRGNNR